MHFFLRCRFALLAGAIVNGSILEPKRSPRRANSTKQLGGSQDDSPFFDNLIDPQPLLLREKSSDILAGGTGSSNPLRSSSESYANLTSSIMASLLHRSSSATNFEIVTR